MGADGHGPLARRRLPRAGRGRRARRGAEPPRDPAQLSGDRPLPLPARVHPARDPAVLHRGRQRVGAVLAPAAIARLPARQERLRQAPVRHADGRLGGRLRMDEPFAAAFGARVARLSRHDRRRPGPAVQREPLQHLGDELRRALGQRHPRAQRRREDRQLRARHRRRLDQPAPPRPRRRPDLGDRLGLLRLLRRRRLVLRGALHRQRARPAGQDDRAEALARRQARPRRRAAGPEGDDRDRRGARRPSPGSTASRRLRTPPSRRRSR